jgi:hypothetical protein
VRHRIEVVEDVLRLLHDVPSETVESIRVRRRGLRTVARRGEARKALAVDLRARRRKRELIQDAIQERWNILGALQGHCLVDGGVLSTPHRPGSGPIYDVGRSPAQFHIRGRRPTPVTWSTTVLEAAASCRVAGAECIEPAILACVQILHALKGLVGESSVVTKDEGKVYDHRGRLRTTARAFLEKLGAGAKSLKELATRIKASEAHVRRFSAPFQRLGLVRMRSDGSWELTAEGNVVLRSS